MPDKSKTSDLPPGKGELVLNDDYRAVLGVASRRTSPTLWFGAHRLEAASPGRWVGGVPMFFVKGFEGLFSKVFEISFWAGIDGRRGGPAGW